MFRSLHSRRTHACTSCHVIWTPSERWVTTLLNNLRSSHLRSHLYARWCERCLLITESPKTPGHYRYLIWVLCYIPDTGLAVFSFAISRVPVYTAIAIPCEFVFSTLKSRSSCGQLTSFCYLGGLRAKCYGYTSCVFVSVIEYFRSVCWVRSTLMCVLVCCYVSAM